MQTGVLPWQGRLSDEDEKESALASSSVGVVGGLVQWEVREQR